MTFQDLKNNIKSAPIIVKQWLVIALLFLIIIIGSILFYRSIQNKNNEAKIQTNEIELSDVKKASEKKASDLKNNTIEHGKFVKENTDEIIKIANDTKFKPIKYETSKVKDASYDAMRSVLDTVQPNK